MLVGRLAVVLVALSALPVVWSWHAAPADRRAPSEATFQPDEVLVDLRDNASAVDVSALETRLGIDLELNSVYSQDEKLMHAHVDPARREAVLAELRRDPEVEAAEPEALFKAFWTPNDPRFKDQWNFKMVHAEKAWDITRGRNVVVAVIDTGVAFEKDDKCYKAKDFADTKFVKGYDFIHNDEHPNDDNGHGTHVAGTIAESTNNGEGVAGLAPEAKIMPLKVLSAGGMGNAADIADAIRFAADHGAKVINMSLGSPFPSAIIHNACVYAHKKGCTIVAAAGNSGSEGVGYPAAWPECIAVSAVGPSGDLAPYSSWGKPVGIAAPGGDKTQGDSAGVLQNTVLQSADDYYSFQGTSMASPHVAAAAALVISRGVTDPAEVRAVLRKSAQPKTPATKYGAGLLDVAAAAKGAAATRSDVAEKAGLGLFPALLCLGLGFAGRRRLLGMPLALGAALALGFLFPDWLTGRLGFSSHLNLLGHSVLLPLLLFTEVEGRKAFRLVSVLGLATAAHLLWDLGHAAAPQLAAAGVVDTWQAVPWLWTNAIVGVGLAVAAFRRGQMAG
jgi:serine protease